MIARGDSHEEPVGLYASDAEALDALIDAGLDPESVPEEHRERALRVGALLGLLDPPPLSRTDNPGHDHELTDRIMSAVRFGREREAVLSAPDGESLESCVMSGFNVSRVPGALRARGERHEAIRRSVTTLGPSNEAWVRSGREERAEGVMRAVASAETAPIPFDRPAPRSSFRLTDLVAAAAMLLLASAVVMPVMGSFSDNAQRQVCMSNLQATGLGLGLYAMSNDDALPMATAGFGGSWSQVGQPGRSHSANLYTLVRTDHVPYWQLACPGNEHAPIEPPGEQARDWRSLEEVSYSYRLMPRGERRLDALESDSVVLADRSPMLLAGLRGQRISPEAPSPNHGREGQHLLQVDDSVVWTARPVLENGDNIWLPHQVERMLQEVRRKFGYVGGYELPASTEDTFLGP
jgi:hypothetical protein